MADSLIAIHGGTAGMTYPGGKNASGVCQRIINLMPPHDTYVEAFVGSGAILRNKRPATRNIAIDASETALSVCQDLASNRQDIEYVHGNALRLLHSRDYDTYKRHTLLYCDPPYPFGTRKGGELYEHELSDEDHRDLMILLNNQRCMVMISGYRCDLYDHWLRKWHRIDYKTQTRRGMVDESLWMNFTPPLALHDYSFLGENFRQRERIKRKKDRWVKRWQNMPRLERQAILAGIEEARGSSTAENGEARSK